MITLGQFLLALIVGVFVGVAMWFLACKYHSLNCRRLPKEYMFFRFSYSLSDDKINELESLSKVGWEIVACIGEDTFAAYLILKRALQTSKAEK